MKEAISKMRQAVATTVLLKSKSGQEHGLYCEQDHRKEFSLYAEAAHLVHSVYVVVRFEKSVAAMRAFADQTIAWVLNMESRLWEIKGINEQFKYFSQWEVTEVYKAMAEMSEELLLFLLPDVINQVHNIIIDSQNKAP